MAFVCVCGSLQPTLTSFKGRERSGFYISFHLRTFGFQVWKSGTRKNDPKVDYESRLPFEDAHFLKIEVMVSVSLGRFDLVSDFKGNLEKKTGFLLLCVTVDIRMKVVVWILKVSLFLVHYLPNCGKI